MLSHRSPEAVRPLILALSAALILGAPIVALAQPAAPTTTETKTTSTATKQHVKGGAAEDQNKRAKHQQEMIKRLKLTDDQAAKVKLIMEAQRAQASELRAKYQGQTGTPENKAEMMKAREALHADTDAKLGQVLSADQMAEWKKMRAEHMKKEGAKEEQEEAQKGNK